MIPFHCFKYDNPIFETNYPEVYNNCNGDCEKYVIEFEDKEFCD